VSGARDAARRNSAIDGRRRTLRGTVAALAAALVGLGAPALAQDQPPPADHAPPPAGDLPAPDAGQTVAPPLPVQEQPLTPLDIFSTGRDTGLGPDLWKGASADLARAVIPSLVDHPLSPAAAALARRVLAAAATAPAGAGADATLGAARARALLALGDAETATMILDHAANVAQNAALAETAAEAALINDEDDKACAIGEALAVDRDAAYWLRLRAFCQARAGKPAAQLTFSLAQEQGKDPVFARMLPVIIAGAGDPGPASLRNGLDYAMSRNLKLDLGPALADAAPPIAARLAPAPEAAAAPPAEADVLAALRAAKTPTAYAAAARLALPGIVQLVQAKGALANPVQLATAALAAHDPATAQAIRTSLTADSVPGASPTDLAILDAALAVAGGQADAPSLDRLIERGGAGDAKEAARAQQAAAFVLALGWPVDPSAFAAFADFNLGRAQAAPARLVALDSAADRAVVGDAALLALAIAEAGGEAGPSAGDRAQIIRALDRAGLKTDARGLAIEGLIDLESR